MSKKIFFNFLFLILISNASLSDENKVYFLDINFIINNSNIGKKLLNELNQKNKDLNLTHSNKEKELENKKNEILSQQNILEKKDFEIKVTNHQKNVDKYLKQKNTDFEELRKIRMDKTNEILGLINEILLNYSKQQNIDMIFNKESLIISNEKFDITNQIIDILNKKN